MNHSNDATECQREKKTNYFNSLFQHIPSKSTGLNKMRPLKGLAVLMCETRTSLHAVQLKGQQGSVLMFCVCCFKNG